MVVLSGKPCLYRAFDGEHRAVTTLRIMKGDCIERMKDIASESIDSVLCDPPYGIKFLHRDFDSLGKGNHQTLWHIKWLSECYRVLKPDGIIRAFSSNRTLHRLADAMVIVGFDISVDQWMYVSGRPKATDVAKMITAYELTGSSSQHAFYELAHGKKREKVEGVHEYIERGKFFSVGDIAQERLDFELSEGGKKWNGWQYALKPSFEPVLIGKKKQLNRADGSVLFTNTGENK